MTKRARKPALPPLELQSDYYLLAIDQAAKSGWSLRRGDKHIASGTAMTVPDMLDAIERLMNCVNYHRLPAIVLFEDHSQFHFGRGNSSVATLLGMGAARGAWQALLNEHARVDEWHKATPLDWGAAVLGLKRNAKSEDRKLAAIRHAYAITGRHVDDNEAEAVCLGLYGVRHIALKKKRGKKVAA